MLPANQSTVTWQAPELPPQPPPPSPATPIEMCLRTGLSAERLRDVYSSLTPAFRARLCDKGLALFYQATSQSWMFPLSV